MLYVVYKVKKVGKPSGCATDLLNGLLSRMTAINAILAPIPSAPKVIRIVAAVWSDGVQINAGPAGLVSFSPFTPNLRPGPTTTAIMPTLPGQPVLPRTPGRPEVLPRLLRDAAKMARALESARDEDCLFSGP